MFKGGDNDLQRAALHRSLLFLRGQQPPAPSSSPSSAPPGASTTSSSGSPPSNSNVSVSSKAANKETDLATKPQPWRYVRWRKAHEKLVQPAKEKKEVRGNFYHKVLPDENLFEVASKYATYPEVLMEANNILNPVNIATGQILWVPRTHLIQWGNTLWSLSGKYGVSIPTIQNANGIKDPNLIYAGDIIVIPEEPDNRLAW